MWKKEQSYKLSSHNINRRYWEKINIINNRLKPEKSLYTCTYVPCHHFAPTCGEYVPGKHRFSLNQNLLPYSRAKETNERKMTCSLN
jgi:hypothetical protein